MPGLFQRPGPQEAPEEVLVEEVLQARLDLSGLIVDAGLVDVPGEVAVVDLALVFTPQRAGLPAVRTTKPPSVAGFDLAAAAVLPSAAPCER